MRSRASDSGPQIDGLDNRPLIDRDCARFRTFIPLYARKQSKATDVRNHNDTGLHEISTDLVVLFCGNGEVFKSDIVASHFADDSDERLVVAENAVRHVPSLAFGFGGIDPILECQ